tara:strand:- start:2534 stop:2731 length:198 start_codon:yes stop_codon:yes gene_type:complete
MAKKSKQEKIVAEVEPKKAYNIIDSEEVLMREMIFDLRDKGFDINRIAARLEIQKTIVEDILINR